MDWALAQHAINANRPTKVAVMGLDYLDYADYRKTDFETLSRRSQEFIRRFETEISQIDYFGTGPGLEDFISRRTSSVAPHEAGVAA
jgi:adenylosuccinate synthase